MPETSRFGLFVVTSLVVLVMPGPAVLYIVSRGVDQGRMAGIVSALGVSAGSLVQVGGAALGLSALLLSSPIAFNVVKYLGAGYLMYLGLRNLVGGVAENEREELKLKTSIRNFTQGLVVQLLSPSSILFFFAFLPQFVSVSRGAVAVQIVFLGLVFVFLAILTGGLWGVAAGTARAWITSDRRLVRAQRYVTGTVFIVLGMAAALSGNAGR
jgi:threonine/homoserine/homoserine lactone efflux protein